MAEARLDRRVLAALTGDELEPTIVQLAHQGRVENTQRADGRSQAFAVAMWPPDILRIVDQRRGVDRTQLVAGRER